MFLKKCTVGVIGTLIFLALAAQATQKSEQAEPSKPVALTNENSFKNDEVRRSYEKLRTTDPDYARAMDLFNRNSYFEALPLLEQLADRYRSDPVATERLGICLIMTSVSPKEAEDRKKQRARARKLLARARELGIEDNLSDYYLSAIPEDGGADAVFSNRKEVNDAMKEGEAAYARRDYTAAIAAYTRAMEADPTLYPAVLFIGDSYFASGQNESAAEWFERATRVSPYQETAYRYWGDALMRLGRMNDARSKFIDAIIAEPYNRQSWSGVTQWINKNQVRAVMPDIKRPKRPEISGVPGEGTQITFDANSFNSQKPKDGTGAWAHYQIAAGAWQAKLFKERFPNEKEYRHTLAEEKESLGIAALMVDEDLQKGVLKPEELDPGIATLLKLQKAGLLESHILINLADKGIAQDYPAYRNVNRNNLFRYLSEFVVPKTAAQ
jgi:tetratricopeptide (TPR) repeat protein